MNQIARMREAQDFSPITLGQNLKSFDINGLVFTETAHKAGQRLPRHYHENANIAFILNGSFTEVLDRRRFECNSHSVIVKPAGEAHSNQYDRGGLHCFLIEVEPERLESLHSLSKVFSGVSHIRGAMLSMLAARIYKETGIMDSASPLAIEGLSLELIAELSRSGRPVGERKLPPWLKQAKEILHAHFADTASLAEVAKTVGVHPVHLAREFRRFYGHTMGEYLRGLRIDFACRKLSTSDMPLVEIALTCGFSHQSHFSRLFKRQIGVTPSEFRSFRTRR